MVVLLTDGRANVSLAKSNRDPDALAEDAPKPTTVSTGKRSLDAHCPPASWRCGCISRIMLLPVVVADKARRRCKPPR